MAAILIVLAMLVFLTCLSRPSRPQTVVVVVPVENQSGGCLDKLIPLLALFIALPFILYVASMTIA